MQSTKQNQAFSTVYSASPIPVPAKVLSPEIKEKQESDRSFMIACCLGAVTVVFGIAALVYQFTPEFNKLRNASSQGEVPDFSTFQG
jgi:hypothetical protein